MNITFHFVTTHDAASALIRWKTDSEISHVEVQTDDGRFLGALVQGGVAVRPANYQTWPLQIFVTIPVTAEQYKSAWDLWNGKVGQKYDMQGIVGIAFGNNLHHPDENFCSELMARGLASIVRIAKDPSKITPEDIRLIVSAIPGSVERRVVG